MPVQKDSKTEDKKEQSTVQTARRLITKNFTDFKKRAAALEKKLKSARRKGINVKSRGIYTQAVSDHMPIQMVYRDRTLVNISDDPNKIYLFPEKGGVSIASWNVLADHHLGNNFLNIAIVNNIKQNSEIKQLKDQFVEKLKQDLETLNSTTPGDKQAIETLNEKINILSKRMPLSNRPHHLMSYLGDFLCAHAKNGKLDINDELIEQFVESYSFNREAGRNPSDLALEANVECAKYEAKKIIEFFLQNQSLGLDNTQHPGTNPERQIFLESCAHAAEIHSSIKGMTTTDKNGIKTHQTGYLQWENRKKILQNDQVLLDKLSENDFICLQECTNPEDMLQMLQKASDEQGYNKAFKMLVHRVNSHTNDHCVVIYDANSYEVENVKNFGMQLRGGKPTKPAIMAGFIDRNNPHIPPVVVGSIHHPGGTDRKTKEPINEMKTIVDAMKEVSSKMPKHDHKPLTFVLGDYNNEDTLFMEAMNKSGLSFLSAPEGSMAGPDYGNTDKGIDAVLSNEIGSVQINVIPMKPATKAELLINVSIGAGLEASPKTAEPYAKDLKNKRKT